VIRRLEPAGELQKAIHDIFDGHDKSVYPWAGANYGASNTLANQLAEAERDRSRRNVLHSVLGSFGIPHLSSRACGPRNLMKIFES
jgi:hypothetical protein